jgi:DNA primase
VFTPYTRELTLRPVHPFLSAKGVTPTVARLFGCGFWPRGGFLRGCIGVRLHDLAGCPLGYAARRLCPHDIAARGKWALPTGLPKRALLYNWHRIDPRAAAVILVEGPFDAMRVHQAGFPAVLALLGTHASPLQLELLRGLQRVILLLDGDPAGAHATTRLLAALHRADAQAIYLRSPCGPADLSDHELASTLATFQG